MTCPNVLIVIWYSVIAFNYNSLIINLICNIYSTNKQAPDVTLEEAVVKGLAADKGLFMPFIH